MLSNGKSPYVGVGLRTHQEGQATALSMSGVLACLRGWHPALARAELAALLPDATLTSTASPRWVRVDDSTDEAQHAALDVASGLQAFLHRGGIHEWSGASQGLMEAVEAYLDEHPVQGTVKVEAWRQDQRIPGVSTSLLAGEIGGLMVHRGWPVDLTSPSHVLALVADGPTSSLAFGWMKGQGPVPFEHRARQATQRPFFKPVSLDPKLARLVVNMAGGPPGSGPVVDPMTGTGGFVIEASLSGRPCIGLDINSEMVAGASANLSWAHGGEAPATSSVRRGDATNLLQALPEHWFGTVAGFVLDPPYGRNSHGTMGSLALLEKTLRSAHEVSKAGGKFVLILPIEPLGERITESVELNEPVQLLHGEWSNLLAAITNQGWNPCEAFVERVHRSLSRLILLAEYVPQG